MSEQIARLVESDPLSDVGGLALQLYGLPRPTTAEAVTVMPGLGEEWRLRGAVRAFNGDDRPSHHQPRLLLVAGINPAEKTFVQPMLDNLPGLKRRTGVHIQQTAEHTKGQAEWVADTVMEQGIESMELHASPYHLLRAYLTVLKTFGERGIEIPIIPMPTAVPPGVRIPEYAGRPDQSDGWGMVAGEMKRILQYQEKGDVATYSDLQAYLGRLYEQPIMQPYVA